MVENFRSQRLLQRATSLAWFLGIAIVAAAFVWWLRPRPVNPKIPWTPAPAWQGTGVLQAAIGAGYPLYLKLRFERKHQGPEPSKGRTNLIGTATICTPQNALFDLEVSGSVDAWFAENGSNVVLYLHNERSAQPKLTLLLYGSWQGTELVLEDRGSLGNSFNPDGTPKAYAPTRTNARHNSEIKLHYGERSAFEAACPAATTVSSE